VNGTSAISATSGKPVRPAVAPVAIVGAGPVGLSLALGLARQGVHSTVLERKRSTSEHSKAPGIHVRTREILRQWGVEEPFLAAGELLSDFSLHSAHPGHRPLLHVNFSCLADDAAQPGILILEQGRTEALLLEAVRASGWCDVQFGAEVVGLRADRDGVRLTVRHDGDAADAADEGGGRRPVDASFLDASFLDASFLDASLVVGCDGANSFVRDALALPFEGFTYALYPMLADVRVDDERDRLPWPRAWTGAGGLTAAIRLRPALWRIIRLERGAPAGGGDVAEQEVRARVAEVLGAGPAEVVWASRFRIHRRAVSRFRHGRVLLAGDAAHIHSPVGGQGMNAGIQDAHNLAWKLAAALDGGDADRLLDSYDGERRAVVVGIVSRSTDLATRVLLQSPALVRAGAVALMRAVLAVPHLRTMALRRAAMLNLRYPASALLDGRERAAGVRVPNPLLRAPDGAAVRLHDLLGAAPVLLDVADDRAFDRDPPAGLAGVAGLADVIRIGPGAHHDPTRSVRRLLGGQDGWILVRPDGYVSWARHRAEGMRAAVEHALGRPAGELAERAGAT